MANARVESAIVPGVQVEFRYRSSEFVQAGFAIFPESPAERQGFPAGFPEKHFWGLLAMEVNPPYSLQAFYLQRSCAGLDDSGDRGVFPLSIAAGFGLQSGV